MAEEEKRRRDCRREMGGDFQYGIELVYAGQCRPPSAGGGVQSGQFDLLLAIRGPRLHTAAMSESGYRIEVVQHHSSRSLSFGWLLYFGTDPRPAQSPRRINATEEAALEAGEKALKEFLRATDQVRG